MSKEIEAGGGTIPAASLYTYYKDKKVFRTFGVVTDEEENGSYFSETLGGGGCQNTPLYILRVMSK